MSSPIPVPRELLERLISDLEILIAISPQPRFVKNSRALEALLVEHAKSPTAPNTTHPDPYAH